MAGIPPKQHARIGMFHLEEAVLDVLLEAKHEGECIGLSEISRRAGIFRDRGEGIVSESGMINDAIATGVLVKLGIESRVQRCPQTRAGHQRGWELTDREFNLRRDDGADEDGG